MAVVTRGTQGIGRAIAQAFARAGWTAAVLGRGEGRLRSTESELSSLDATVLALKADVADAAKVEAAATCVQAEIGPIAVWVNNAMATVIGSAETIGSDEFRRGTEVTHHGQMFGTIATLRFMRLRRLGHTIQVSSALAIRSAPLQAAPLRRQARRHRFHRQPSGGAASRQSRYATDGGLPAAVNAPQFDTQRNHTGHPQNARVPVYDPRLCAEAILVAVCSPVRDVWIGRSVLESLQAGPASIRIRRTA